EIQWKKDSIRTQYHPRSQLPTTVVDFDDYQARPSPQPHVFADPYSPFKSRTDFEFAEIALKSALTQDQIDAMIQLFERVKSGQDSFNITSHRHLRETWEAASHFVTEFKKQEMIYVYKEYELSSSFWHCDLWLWAVDLIKNPILADKFVWDACVLSKWNGSEFVRFIHEPWTAERFWLVQSELPDPRGKPLGFIIYADQTRLSTFGGQKGYPIIARLANLPSEIRNGKGLGGGRVVGLLPLVNVSSMRTYFYNFLTRLLQVKDDAEHKDKPEWVNFKRVIWHDSFRVLLKAISMKFGHWLECGDSIERLLFPFIVILCADYEEQYVNI
ncbi:hypothetical protein CVT24_006721, partial [Panaeolus cyanescens]